MNAGPRTFLLPDLGEGLTEAEIVTWLVAEGDVVSVDQPVVEVETAKSVVEVPTPYAGRVTTLHGAAGETRSVGTPLLSVTEDVPAAAAGGGDAVRPDAPVHLHREPASAGGGDAVRPGAPVHLHREPESARLGDAESDGGSTGVAAETYREEEQAGSGNVLIGYGTSEQKASGRRRRPRGAITGRPSPATGTTRSGLGTALATAPSPSSGVPSRAAKTAMRPARVVSPLVRRLAADRGIDLRQVEPTGLGGIITRADVDKATASATKAASAVTAPAPAQASTGVAPHPGAPADATPGETRIPLNGFRKAVSAALSRSRSEIPEATVWVDVDATPLVELREAARTATDPGPGLLAYVARFVVAGLQAYPVLNARLDTERQEVVQLDTINLGIAVQGDRGLVVPAVMGAQSMSTLRLDEEIRRVSAVAREGRTPPEELAAGTFTLNNYGAFRVDGSAAIINHPQVAILGMGRIIDRPWVVDGQVVPRKITQLSFVFDHRVCDGGTAAGFIRSVADAMENPASAIARL